MGLVSYAKYELGLLQKEADADGNDGSEMQSMINNQILEVVEVFANQGHTGFTAGYALGILERLLNYKPIKPLTGEDDEWLVVDEDTLQNKRCHSVFKKSDGTVYDLDYYRISDNGGINWFTNWLSRKDLTFPYYPPTHSEKKYVKWIDRDNLEYIDITNDPEEIKRLHDEKRAEMDSAEWE